MQMIPDSVPNEARTYPAVRQLKPMHRLESVPAKRIGLQDGRELEQTLTAGRVERAPFIPVHALALCLIARFIAPAILPPRIVL